MGLLKQGFKYGGLAYAARSIGKGVAAREESKVAAAAAAATPTTSAPADGQYQQQRGEARELPAYDAMDGWGYAHASWCDRSCGGRCGARVE